jgi:hypothetical protein
MRGCRERSYEQTTDDSLMANDEDVLLTFELHDDGLESDNDVSI